jgi:hypothetical protein
MGYRNVEHANYSDRTFYGYAPKEFKKIFNDLGMKMLSGHTVFGKEHRNNATNDFTDLWKYTIEDTAGMGQQYIISPRLEEDYRKTYDALKKYMEVLNKNGACVRSGVCNLVATINLNLAISWMANQYMKLFWKILIQPL